MDDGPILIERDDQTDALVRRLRSGQPVLMATSRSDGTWGLDPHLIHERLGDLVDVVGICSVGVSRALERRLRSAGLDGYDTYGGAVRGVAAGGETRLFFCYENDDPLLVVGELRSWVERHAQQTGAKLEVLERRVAELTAERDALARRLDQAVRQCDTSEPAEPEPLAVFEDAEKQLRHEVWLAWLSSAPEGQRGEMQDYLIGPDFVDDLAQDLIHRGRVVKVMVEVLRDVIWDKHAREVHQMRVSDHGGSPARVRSDGAVAWRAAVKRNSPGAPRLMWWALPDGGVEFARATHHDDTRMR